MSREIVESSALQYCQYVCTDKDMSQLISLRCGHCNKFISKKWKKFYCPHCEISFLPNISTEEQKKTQELIDYLKQVEQYTNLQQIHFISNS